MATQCLPFSISKLYAKWTRQENQSESYPIDSKCHLFKEHKQLRETSIQVMLKLKSKYQFKPDTLFLAIQILDQLIEMRFKDPFRDPELVGGVLILLATKYNEVYPVIIDQINLSITKYYHREAFYEIEGLILEAINFEIPSTTLYSQIYNELESAKSNKVKSDSDKENESHSSNYDTDCSEKDYSCDKKDLPTQTLEVLREPDCFKYGEKIMYSALLSYFRK